MQTAKQEVSNLLKHLPEDCSLEDIQYHLYVLQKIERGMKDAMVIKIRNAESWLLKADSALRRMYG